MATKSPPMPSDLEDAGLDLPAPGRLPFDLIAIVVMAVIGLGISIYLTTVHYANAPLVCSAGGIVNCAEVTRSSYSVVPGTNIPVTIPGMLWFFVSASLALLSWQIQSGRTSLLARFGVAGDERLPLRLGLALFAWCVCGLAAVFYLIYGETKLHKICEWCTGVHILTAITFFIALYRLLAMIDSQADELDDDESLSEG